MATVRVERSLDGQVVTILLHRSHARNAVDRKMASELHAAFLDFEHDAHAKVALLHGVGGVFCAGADLKAISETTSSSGTSSSGNRVNEPSLTDGLQAGPMGPTRLCLSKPVIAAIEGHAVAGGLELACWCDLRICDDSVVFGVFCRRWGVPLVDGGTVRLPRLIEQSRALDMILTGRAVDAKEALAMGLANRVVLRGTARQAAEGLAHDMARFPQACMRMDRQSALEQWGLPEQTAIHREYVLGRTVLAEGVKGAARFRDGAGRGGSFANL